jgi:L-lysine exporter family protein LysE/ArgO
VPTSPVLVAVFGGLGLGFSLIVAIGAQNAFVLRQGLRREHVPTVVVICALSDVVLIAAGTAGAGAALGRAPGLLMVVRLIGAAYLLTFGAVAARRASHPGSLAPDGSAAPLSRTAAIATGLALTWLNPHVYLDTVVVLGSVAATHGGRRWAFAAGAALASGIWFAGLGVGARVLTPIFARPLAWRLLDVAIAVVMVTVAGSLLLPVLLPPR